MSLSHGNDPEILDGVGDALLVEAERVQTLASTGTSGIAVLVESWAGPDMEVFGADWRTAQQQLDAASQLLRVVGERAKGQAQQQREASGEGAAAGPLPARAVTASGSARPPERTRSHRDLCLRTSP